MLIINLRSIMWYGCSRKYKDAKAQVHARRVEFVHGHHTSSHVANLWNFQPTLERLTIWPCGWRMPKCNYQIYSFIVINIDPI